MKMTYIVVASAICFMMLRAAWSDTKIKPDSAWTDVEAGAWEQIQMGKEVRLSGSCPDKENAKTEVDSNLSRSDFSLRGVFLQQILNELPYRDITSKQPIVLHGAHVAGNMFADGGTSHSRIDVTCSTFDGAVQFNDWDFLRRVHFDKVKARGTIRLQDVDAKSRFTISNSDVRDIAISESNINGILSFKNTKVHKGVSILNTKVETSLQMGCSEARSSRKPCTSYGSTRFTNLSVGRSIVLVGSLFKGRTIFENIDLAGNLIADEVHYADILIFIGGEIDGRIYMNRNSSQSVYLRGTVVRGGLDLRDGHHGTVKILDSDIYRDLDLTETDIGHFLDITGTHVHGALRLAPLSKAEQEKADVANKGFRRHFTARNAHVRILEDTKDAWDRWSVLDLNGFEYDKVSSPSTSVQSRADNPYLRDAQWFKNWLKGMKTYSPQPYSQLSALLRREGQIKTANAILFEGKERERRSLLWGEPRRWWLEVLRLSIGYGVGFKAFYALRWMALFAALGWLVFTRRATRKDEDDKIAGFRDRFWYSMTFTVPGFTLVAGDELTVSPRAQCWLYFQRLVCFALALLAGAAAIGIIRP